jgi:hypothetical protein
MNQEKQNKLNKIIADFSCYFEKLEFEDERQEKKFNQSVSEVHSFLSEISASGEVDLRQIYIPRPIAKIVFLQLSEFTTLETLRIDCPEDQHVLVIFVEALSKLSDLITLEVNGGILFSGGFSKFMGLLDNLVNLKTLILKSTPLHRPQDRIGTKQVDDLLVLAMNSKYGLEKIVVDSPDVDPADLELFTIAIKLRKKIVDKPKFAFFLMGNHPRAGQDSSTRLLYLDIFETIWKQGSFDFNDIKNSQIVRLLQRIDPGKSKQLSLLNPDQDLDKNQRKEIIEHLAKKFILVAPSLEFRAQSATSSISSGIANDY